MSKIVALMSGGDWFDASVEHLVVPDGIDLEREKAAWDEWYVNEYCSHTSGEKVEYIDFADWLRRRGARSTTDDEVFEFWIHDGLFSSR